MSFIILIVATVLLFKYQQQNKNDQLDYDEIEQKGIIHIVTSFDPVGYFVSSDTISGYNHDILDALQKYTNIQFEITVENSLDKSFNGLKDGRYDIIARSIPVNSELRNEYSFTEPTIFNKLVLVQRKAEFNDSIQPIRNHLELAKKTIHTPKDSPSILRLANLSREIGDSIFVVEDDLYEADQLALMVASGEIDFTVCDNKTAEKLSKKIHELDIDTDIGFTHLEAWAVRTSSPVLLDSLNIWINRFKTTKEYSLIRQKYYK